ncbi:hypothetical protein SAMN04244572_04835 [Azotobacter beijerinckii]|uniref:Uncharacterized protein n=1 Tax=Azotobacter beijerinckii TaxID=170623 RepID=A0A1H7AWC6_9GAMM|nr:hypothetical protein [Azotobacter beijerinckii]SEJ66412.1 hypothetical protein SAMN04244572_04835 [Azotobacter beijerinckii]
MKSIRPQHQQSSRSCSQFTKLIHLLFSRDSAFNLLITLAQIAMYWLMLEVCHG